MTDTRQATSPSDLAEAITGRRHVSWSQVQCYQQCPMKFRLRYVDGVKPDFVPSSLAFGGAVHEALETFCQHAMEGLPIQEPKPFVERFSEAWEEAAAGEEVRFNRKESPQTILGLGRRMIEAFVASPTGQPSGQILGIEEELRAPIDDSLPDMLARLDLVEADRDGRVTITDFKTSKSRWNEDKLVENAAQLQLYGGLAARTGLANGGVVKLRFVVLTKAVTPVVQALDVEHDADRLASTKRMVADVWSGIVAGVFPVRPGWPCRMCPYGSSCDVA